LNNPLVSIITPTYKHEDFIGECIESVLGQTYDNWEQIIIDDCSPDKTLEKIYSYKDSRIRVIQNKERGGPSKLHVSYNNALELANGELIAVLEGDDCWPKDKLEKQVPIHEKHVVLTWGLAAEKFENKIVMPQKKRNQRQQKICPDLNELLLGNIIPAVTVMIRKNELCKIGGFWQPVGAVLVDYPTWLLLKRFGYFVFIPAILGIHRIHDQQISKKHATTMLESSIYYIDDILARLNTIEKRNLNMRHVTAAQCLRRASLSEKVSDIIQAKKYYRKVLALGNLQQCFKAVKKLLLLRDV